MLSTFINYSQIVTDLKEAVSDIFRTNVKVLQYIKNEEYEKIYEEITKAIDYSEYLKCQTSYDDKLHNLETLSVKTYDVFENIINAIKDKDIESLKNEREKIEKIYIVYVDEITNIYVSCENKKFTFYFKYNDNVIEFYYMKDNEKIYLIPINKNTNYTYIESEKEKN